MNDFISVFLLFLQSIPSLDIFLYFLAAFTLLCVILLVKHLIY